MYTLTTGLRTTSPPPGWAIGANHRVHLLDTSYLGEPVYYDASLITPDYSPAEFPYLTRPKPGGSGRDRERQRERPTH